ncbi:Receptor-Type Tyrosine-Protein Phosphatase Eta [Manis pentadactyla]|nr:Receptor-Type Tyrosine-Protein Phosphatase Eta [Manis pentadactyla]
MEQKGTGNGRRFGSLQIGFLLDLAVPAPPASLSLGLAAQPPALTASWSPPPGGRGGFQLQLFCLRPLTLESEQILGPEVQNFSWAQLLPGTQSLVQLCTNNSGCTNAMGWMRTQYHVQLVSQAGPLHAADHCLQLDWRTHRPISIHNLQQSFEAKTAHAHQACFQEFGELKVVGKEQSRLEAEHPANATKNCYPHVLPWVCPPTGIHCYPGALKKTLEDFWRPVWEQQVHITVMLTVGMANGLPSSNGESDAAAVHHLA